MSEAGSDMSEDPFPEMNETPAALMQIRRLKEGIRQLKELGKDQRSVAEACGETHPAMTELVLDVHVVLRVDRQSGDSQLCSHPWHPVREMRRSYIQKDKRLNTRKS